MEMEIAPKPNPDVTLKTYEIISKYLEKEKDKEGEGEDKGEAEAVEEEEDFKFKFPTPESLQKLCEPQTVKNVLTFDLEKYSSYFQEDKLNLDKIESIKDKEMAKILIMFLGYINSENDVYDLFSESQSIIEEKRYIDNDENYWIYLNFCIDFLKMNNHNFNAISDIDTFVQILSDMGINLENKEKNELYLKIKKDLFFSNEKNKILILLAPSNNFWIKSEKSSINDINYDMKLNNYTNIFYNKNFIQKFFEKIINNPRCHFGLISSMNFKNLRNCWDTLGKLDNQISEIFPKNIIFIDQNLHEELKNPDPKNKKKTFFRSMEKIINSLKNKKGKNKNDDNNTGYYDENNILILESETDKMTDSTRNNSIKLNVFSEEYLQKNEKEKASTDLEVDKFLQYLVNLLDKCGDDIRTYIKQNPF